MLLKMKMPDLATTGGTMKIVEWKAEVGQVVKRGDVLLDVETDKAMTEVECIAAGTLLEQSVRPGDDVLAGDLIAVIEVNR
jgi:pyruvate dehydrogenase E2 component (dihydrolipoamide acetyltransferase)